VDVDDTSLKFLERMLKIAGYPGSDGITIHLATVEDNGLPAATFDKVLVISIPGMDAQLNEQGMPEIVSPRVKAFFQGLKRTLRPGGEIQIHYENGLKKTTNKFVRKVDSLDNPAEANLRHSLPLEAVGLEVVAIENRTIWGADYEVVRARLPK
jgi:hypothetical protein